jgi:hypothetical protein
MIERDFGSREIHEAFEAGAALLNGGVAHLGGIARGQDG